MSGCQKNEAAVRPSEITSETIYLQRRQWLGQLALLGVGVAALPWSAQAAYSVPAWMNNRLHGTRTREVTTTDSLTPFKDVTGYNNFYEFGLEKTDPLAEAYRLSTDPWSVKVSGLCDLPGHYTLEDILKPVALEDRVYRFRCVEAWSMVIPWLGFPLGSLLKRLRPQSAARYVRFTTLYRPEEMPGQRHAGLAWPYVEGLRLDEAMHPLAMLAIGLYGRALLPQNGAPLRLVLPWKYGFKSIKSIVAIEFVAAPPQTTWATMAPHEYGFYANVNPAVDHPRWSQARERRLPATLWEPNWRTTLMFNGYASVAPLYQGMDLRRNF